MRAWLAEGVPGLPAFDPARPLLLREAFGKWIAFPDPGHVLRVPKHEAARASMARERRVLAALAGRLPLAVPETVAEGPGGAFDVQTRLPGEGFAPSWWDALPVARSRPVAEALGAFLAALHGALDETTVAALDLGPPTWPTPPEEIARRLEGRLGEPACREFLARLPERVAALEAQEHRRRPRLLHGDLLAHNLTWRREPPEILGVLDWTDACLGDPHRDFRYLHSLGEDAALRAVARYNATAADPVDPDRVRFLHAWTAFAHAAFALEEPGPRRATAMLAWARSAAREAP